MSTRVSTRVKTRRRIALLVETSRSYGRDLLRGIAAFTRTRNHWSLLHQEMTIDVRLPRWMRESQIDGVIARVDSRIVEPLRQLGVPCVDVRCSQRLTDFPQVETDDEQVAHLAFQHLWEHGFRRFAFCGFKHAHYSEARLVSFHRTADQARCPLSIYETHVPQATSITGVEESGISQADSLANWLTSLTRPTGMLVCNDIRGQQVLNVCSALGLSVPEDLAVIGVDNDDTICPLSNPTLSSVQPDAERVGYRAAEILDAMIEKQHAPSEIEYISPKAVIQRLSTQVIAVEDREIARVCGFIREHACDGINVNDVAEFTHLSRRQLERRFRSELNRSPHEQITAVQIDRVKQLLRESDLTLEQIASLVGYRHKEQLGTIFKRVCGETPGSYRKHFLSTGP